MLVREAKLCKASKVQYRALDEAIRTAQFIRNKAVQFWHNDTQVNRARISVLCKELARVFPFKKLQRRLSKKFVRGKKPQSNNYDKARIRLGKSHVLVQRQGMNILGVEWNSGATPHGFPVLGNAHQESTPGHWGTTGKPGTLGETSASVDEGQLDSISSVIEPRIAISENPAL